MNELLVFRSFYTEEEALSLLNFLKENGIDCSIVKNRQIMDKMYVGIDYDRPFHVKIKSSEFNKANELLDARVAQNLSHIGPDYYLYSFSKEELLEIIERPDEWNNQDFVISKKILEDRGVVISDTDIREKKLKRIKELAKPAKEAKSFIILGYILAIFFAPGGIIFGSLITNAKKTLPDGNRFFAYDKNTRDHGKSISIIGVIITILILFRILLQL